MYNVTVKFLVFFIFFILVSGLSVVQAEENTRAKVGLEVYKGTGKGDAYLGEIDTLSLMADHRARKNGVQTDCDRLTTHKRNPDRQAMPVEFGDIDAKKSISACLKDLEKDPNNGRLMVNLSRAYNKAEDYPASIQWVKKSMDTGYGFSYFLMSVFYAHGDGVEKSRSQEEKYLKKAMNSGVPFAQLGLAHFYLEKTDPATVTDEERAKIIGLIEKSEHVPGVTHSAWGHYYFLLAKRVVYKAVPSHEDRRYVFDNPAVAAKKMSSSEFREYMNMLNNALAHYEDSLTEDEDEAVVKKKEQVQKLRAPFL